MITLNTDRELIRLAAWSETESIPGFTPNIDPSKIQLKSIIGSYSFADFIPCGLTTCHQPHGRGYLVATTDGRVTNIGHDCGKKYFSVVFEEMARRFDRDLRAKEQRELVAAAKGRLPEIEARIARMKEGQRGANWIYRNIQALTERHRGLPDSVVKVTSDIARSRNLTLTKSRRATKEERDLMIAAGQRVFAESYVDDVVGQLEGAAALYAENDLRNLLVTKLRPHLDEIAGADIEALGAGDLRRLSKWAAEIDPTLAHAEVVIDHATRLLTRANLEQLVTYATTKSEREQMARFISALPSGSEQFAA